MSNGLIRLLNRNKRQTIAALLVLLCVYSIFFVAMANTSIASIASQNFQDRTYQNCIEMSDEIIIIGITSNDINITNKTKEELATNLVEYINENSNYSSIIGVDIPLEGFSTKNVKKLEEESEKNSNIIIQNNISLYNPVVFDNFGFINREMILQKRTSLDTLTKAYTIRVTDEGGVLRRGILNVSNGARTYKSLPLLVYEKYCEANQITPKIPHYKNGSTPMLRFSSIEDSLFHLTAKDVLINTHHTDFSNKIVLIGCFDSSASQSYITAISSTQTMFSTSVDANIINCLLQNKFVGNIDKWIQVVVLILCVLFICVIAYTCSPFASICISLIYLIFDAIFSLLLWGVGYTGASLPHFINATFSCAIVLIFKTAITNAKARLEIENTLGKYVDSNILKNIIGKDVEDLLNKDNAKKVESSEKTVAVLFADIRNFTRLSEEVAPKLLAEILNSYLSMMAECINRYRGTVDKFIGDCVMGYWDLSNDANAVYLACLAANEMQRKSKLIVEEYKNRFNTEIGIGIGISYGSAVMGNFGSYDRIDYTIVGNAVNTASRLEAIAHIGEIYLSKQAYEMLSGKATCEKFSENILLKGKQYPEEVYKLQGISFESRTKKKDIKTQVENNENRLKALICVFISVLSIFTEYIYAFNGVRTMGINALAYFPFVLSALCFVLTVMTLQYEIKSYNKDDGIISTPRWFNYFKITNASAQATIAFSFFMLVVTKNGLGSYLRNYWLGGIMTYLINPVLVILSFIVFQKNIHVDKKNAIGSFLTISLLNIFTPIFLKSSNLGIDNISVYRDFYSMPAIINFIGVEIIVVGLLYFISTRKELDLDSSTKIKINDFISEKWRKSGIRKIISSPKILAYISIIGNIIVAVFSIDVTIKSIRIGGIDFYSNPSLIGIVELTCCISAVICFTLSRIRKNKLIDIPFYNYVSFARMLGCLINFISVLIISLDGGGGIEEFFKPHWYGDYKVFLICPLISLVTWIVEKNEYSLFGCLLVSTPYAVIPFISKAAIMSLPSIENYSAEMANFYEAKKVITIAGFIIVLAILSYYINSMINNLLYNEKNSPDLYICGCNGSASPRTAYLKEYGGSSECYVIKDGDYALIINAGSGIEKAAKITENCRHIDIILPSSKFSNIMGLLSSISLNKEAKIRIFSDFDVKNFSATPFWPINGIKNGVKQISPNRKYKLNSKYSFTIIPNDLDSSNSILKIDGYVSFLYCNLTEKILHSNLEAIRDSKFMIVSGTDYCKEACYLAIDKNISSLIFSGYSSTLDKQSIETIKEETTKIMRSSIFATEESRYSFFEL